ncbi:MAG: hypothetical protein N4A47_02185 [Clostridia bacterium]|jgi:hypothetical protein|nr:hypothetical protein [Clostridia bacterium]
MVGSYWDEIKSLVERPIRYPKICWDEALARDKEKYIEVVDSYNEKKTELIISGITALGLGVGSVAALVVPEILGVEFSLARYLSITAIAVVSGVITMEKIPEYCNQRDEVKKLEQNQLKISRNSIRMGFGEQYFSPTGPCTLFNYHDGSSIAEISNIEIESDEYKKSEGVISTLTNFYGKGFTVEEEDDFLMFTYH